MLFEEACRILSLSGEESRTDIKKKYRQLMHRVHPDVLGDKPSEFAFSAWEINAAYEVLLNKPEEFLKDHSHEKSKHKTDRWQAAVNENAYMERDIYVDHICIGSGKYYYTEEEGFPMFLQSIYRCSLKLLQEFSDVVIRKHLGEIAYLLSQQFVDREMILERYEADMQSREMVYYFPAMLETEGKRCALSAGTILTPGGVRNHRLYLNNLAGKEVGYVSFHDDLVYYALIPLFEQRRAKIKTRVSGSISGNNNKRAVKVRTLDLWVQMIPCDWEQVEVRLSDQIDAIIRKCKASVNSL